MRLEQHLLTKLSLQPVKIVELEDAISLKKFRKYVMMTDYKSLVFLITFVNICALISTPIGKALLMYPRVAYGYSKGEDLFLLIIMYILVFLCIPFSIANYKNLVENNLTTHSKAKQLYAYLTPILTFIAIIFLGIFVK